MSLPFRVDSGLAYTLRLVSHNGLSARNGCGFCLKFASNSATSSLVFRLPFFVMEIPWVIIDATEFSDAVLKPQRGKQRIVLTQKSRQKFMTAVAQISPIEMELIRAENGCANFSMPTWKNRVERRIFSTFNLVGNFPQTSPVV